MDVGIIPRAVRGAAGGDGRAGMVGGVFRVYKGPLGPAVEVGGSPPLRPPPPPPHGIWLAAVEWPHQKGSHFPKGVAPAGTWPGGRRRCKARWSVPS